MSPVPSPMLATLGPLPGNAQGWAVEFKWDGARCIAVIDSSTTRLLSRNGNNVSSSYPELVTALLAALGGRSAVLDGEIVAVDREGRPSFSRLQRRMHVQKPSGQLVAGTPTRLYIFDILAIDGRDTTGLPYLERRELLDELALAGTTIQIPPFWTDVDSAAMLDVALEHDLEGLVLKRLTSSYQAGRRSPAWRKVPVRLSCEAVVLGFIAGSGSAADGVGSLLLGAHNAAGDLVYIGQVGTGFTAKARRALLTQLEEMEQPDPPISASPPRSVARHARWVRAELVGDVHYREFTGRLRHASWRGLRSDKTVRQVSWPGAD